MRTAQAVETTAPDHSRIAGAMRVRQIRGFHAHVQRSTNWLTADDLAELGRYLLDLAATQR
jgi:hypothetical protein